MELCLNLNIQDVRNFTGDVRTSNLNLNKFPERTALRKTAIITHPCSSAVANWFTGMAEQIDRLIWRRSIADTDEKLLWWSHYEILGTSNMTNVCIYLTRFLRQWTCMYYMSVICRHRETTHTKTLVHSTIGMNKSCNVGNSKYRDVIYSICENSLDTWLSLVRWENNLW